MAVSYNISLNEIRKDKDIPFDASLIGKFLGEGIEGSVYLYGKNKVIKIMDTFDDFSNKDFYRIMRKLKKYPSKMYATVYDFGEFLHMGTRHWSSDNKSKSTYYYYIIERLYKVPKCIDRKLWSRRAKLLKKKRLSYKDPHPGNFMTDKNGNPKLIDLTSFCWHHRNSGYLPLSAEKEIFK